MKRSYCAPECALAEEYDKLCKELGTVRQLHVQNKELWEKLEKAREEVLELEAEIRELKW